MENGRIAKAAAAQNPAAVKPLDKLKSILASDNVKSRLAATMNENAGAFSSSIIELFTSDTKLSQCDPIKVTGEALKAAALKLPINKAFGFIYIIPYKDGKTGEYIPQFQLGYKGYMQLLMRSGAYKYVNCDVVYEGELVSSDKLTGAIDLTGTKNGDKIIGYFAYIETLNGFSKTLYMSYDEMVAHAKKYSKSAYNGKLGGVWASDFDAMAKKTCLRLLIGKYGIMSVDMQSAYIADASPADYNDIPDVENNEPLDIAIDENGEVVEIEEKGGSDSAANT